MVVPSLLCSELGSTRASMAVLSQIEATPGAVTAAQAIPEDVFVLFHLGRRGGVLIVLVGLDGGGRRGRGRRGLRQRICRGQRKQGRERKRPYLPRRCP